MAKLVYSAITSLDGYVADEDLHGIEATAPVPIQETVRVGWLVHISDADGPHVFEQQAYVTERDAQIDWMRVMCSGWIALPEAPA